MHPENSASMSSKQAGLLLAAVVIAAVVYVFAVRHFQADSEPQTQTFSIGKPPVDRLEIGAQIMAVDPVKDSFQIRFTFKPRGKYAADRFGKFASDVHVVIVTADGHQSIDLDAGEIPGTVLKDVELDEGSPNAYPLDHYTARIGISAFTQPKHSRAERLVPVVVQYEDDLGNYAITANLGPESARALVDIRLFIRRSSAILTFSVLMLAAIVLVSASVLILNLLVLVRRIDSDFGMMLWSGAMLFALPAVRNSLPDSPPLAFRPISTFLCGQNLPSLFRWLA